VKTYGRWDFDPQSRTVFEFLTWFDIYTDNVSHRQVAVDMIEKFVGGVVVASTNPWIRRFFTRIAVIQRRLQ